MTSLKSDKVVLLDHGECVQGEPAREREGQLVSCRQAGQQHWRDKGVTDQEHGGTVSVVLVVVGRGVITIGEHGTPSDVLTPSFAPHRTFGVASVTPVVLVPFASPCLSGA